MSKIVQLVGDLLSAANLYTGPDRELRVDTSSYNLRLHDGVTQGGHEILNRDNADARYQLNNAEVDGIGPFLATDRGILTRLGVSDYRLRMITVSSSLTIANPDGFGGNFAFDIAATINGDKIFSGNVSISGGLTVTAGINADTSGHHFGLVTGDVTGNLTGNVTGAAGTFTSFCNSDHFAAVDGFYWYNSAAYGGGNIRWRLNRNGAEGGANAGSNLILSSFSDSGAFLQNVYTINRATGFFDYYGATHLHSTLLVDGEITGNLAGNVDGGYFHGFDITCSTFAATLYATMGNGCDLIGNSGSNLSARIRPFGSNTIGVIEFTNPAASTHWAYLTCNNAGQISAEHDLVAGNNLIAQIGLFNQYVTAITDASGASAFKAVARTADDVSRIQFTNHAQSVEWAGIKATNGHLFIENADLTAAMGFFGPLTGNTTGTHTGPVIGNVTGNTSGSSGSCTGNAATATKWQTARNINLTGAVTGTVSLDGTGDVNLATTYSSTVFTSAAVAITINSNILIAHGAGARPATVELYLRCTAAIGVFTVGEDIACPGWSWDNAAVLYNASVSIVDAINCRITQGNAIRIHDGAGGNLGCTSANFELRVKTRL